MNTHPIPRSLLQAKLPIQRKIRLSSSGLSLSIPCTTPTGSFIKGGKLGERSRVSGVRVVGRVRVVIVRYLLEELVGGERMWW